MVVGGWLTCESTYNPKHQARGWGEGWEVVELVCGWGGECPSGVGEGPKAWESILGVPMPSKDAIAQVGWGCTGCPELLGAQNCSRLPRAAAAVKVATSTPLGPNPSPPSMPPRVFL